MGNLYLVRHGQASFGAADYDQLSPLGQRQSERLGAYLRAQGLAFDAVLTGTLRRHAQTWQGIASGGGYQQLAPHLLPALNEYDSQALIAALQPGPLAKPDNPERYRQYFRLLRDALGQWMDGVISPAGMPSYDAFRQGVRTVLEQVRSEHQGQRVLLVSSGGPIATALGLVLGTMPETTIALNMQLRNSALSECLITPRRHLLVGFNSVAHLDGPDQADWLTYA